MTDIRHWVAGARPRTLPAAVAPVLVGSATAVWEAAFEPVRAGLALAVALALQIGVNYSNDYSDGVRGTDEQRVGPVRLVGQGLASPAAVKRAALLSFAAAAGFGLALTLLSAQWWFIPLGLLAIWSAWAYTGGKNPYGYLGFGELFVFVWFGLAAVIGTSFAQTGRITGLAIVLAVGSGGFACALLVVNNLRDRAGDAVVGKRTLAVRLGDLATRWLFTALIWLGIGSTVVVVALAVLSDPVAWPIGAALGLLAALAAHVPGRAVLAGANGRDLITALAGTSRAQLVWAVATTVGITAQRYLA